MKLFVTKEAASEETRVPMLPAEVGKLVQLGAEVTVEAGIGKSIHIPDEAYPEVGASVTKGRKTALEHQPVYFKDYEDVLFAGFSAAEAAKFRERLIDMIENLEAADQESKPVAETTAARAANA